MPPPPTQPAFALSPFPHVPQSRTHRCAPQRPSQPQACLKRPRNLPALLSAASAATLAVLFAARRARLAPPLQHLLPGAAGALALCAGVLTTRAATPDADLEETRSREAKQRDVGPEPASVFGASRAEWEDGRVDGVEAHSDRRRDGEASRREASASGSTVYSYAYGRSRKRVRVERGGDADEERAGGSAFAYMREEFAAGEGGGDVPRAEVEVVGVEGGEFLEYEEAEGGWEEAEKPRGVSTGGLGRRVVGLPVWVAREVVVPVVEVGALLWFDFKVAVLGVGRRSGRVGLDRWFLGEMHGWEGGRADERRLEADDVELTEEERQVRDVEIAVKKVVSGVSGTVRRVWDELNLF